MAETWRNANYQKRVEIAVQAAFIDGNLTDFPALVLLTTTSLSGGNGIASADLASKRYQLYETGNATPLKYEEEVYDDDDGGSGKATFSTWVKVSDLYAAPAGDQNKVWLYYGTYDPGSDQDDPPSVWDANFLAVYHFAGNVNDSTSNGYTATDSGTDDIAGKIGRARDFDGTDKIGTPTLAAANTPPYTISAWVRSDSATPSTPTRWVVTDGATEILLLTTPGDFGFYVGGSGQTDGAVTTDLWAHMALSANTGGTTAYGYVNGTPGAAFGSAHTAAAHSFNIGNRGAMDRGWYGQIDELRFNSSIRSAAWIKFEHANVAQADNELTWGSEEAAPAAAAGGIFVPAFADSLASAWR